MTVYPWVVETVSLKIHPVLLPTSVYNCKCLRVYSCISTNRV